MAIFCTSYPLPFQAIVFYFYEWHKCVARVIAQMSLQVFVNTFLVKFYYAFKRRTFT